MAKVSSWVRSLYLQVTVIEEAIKYIDHLHEALRNKFTERGLPPSLQGTYNMTVSGIPLSLAQNNNDSQSLRLMTPHILAVL